MSFGFIPDVTLKSEEKFEGLRDISPLRIDRYVIPIRFCFETDGLQHFQSTSFNFDYPGNDLNDRMKKDLIKDKYCLENGLSLMRIPCNMTNRKKIMEMMIQAFNLCQQGYQIYVTYQHYFDEIIKTVKIDTTKVMIAIVKCPKLKYK